METFQQKVQQQVDDIALDREAEELVQANEIFQKIGFSEEIKDFIKPAIPQPKRKVNTDRHVIFLFFFS